MIYKILSNDDVEHLKKSLTKKDFVDGKKSQQLSSIYNIKQNKETPIVGEVDSYLENLFTTKRILKTVYAPTRVTTQIYNKYVKDDFYDYHVDSFRSSIGNMFYNYGFTLGLSDDYEGGEFVLQTEAGEIGYQIKKGEVVIFPIIYPHKVNVVTKGCRENLIGWFESKVSYEQSYILKAVAEIANTNIALLKTDSSSTVFKNLLTKTALVQNYLVTKWGF